MLRRFLEEYEARRPDDVLRIKKAIDTRYEITELQRKLDSLKKYPILIFEKPITYQGVVSDYMLVTNLTANREICADMLGINPKNVAVEFTKRASHRYEPVLVSKEEAPCREVIKKDEDVNIWEFPITIHNFMDPGPYIGSGYVTTTDPETGVDNSALQRIWVKNPRRCGFWSSPRGHNSYNMTRWWEKGEDAPVAIWIGHHPSGMAGAQLRVPYPESHYPSMGGLLGEPVRLVETELFGDSLKVPADAEMVLEGYILKDTWEAEGPFGEFPGYTGPQRPSTVIEVKCITHRKDAIYHDIGVGLADHLVSLGNFPMESQIYTILKQSIPEVTNVHVPVSGRRNHVYVQVKKTRPGIGKDVIANTLALDNRIKHVFVMDEDVDIFNEDEILWSIAYRSQWNKDVVVVEGMTTTPLDPSISSPGTIGTKGGIDCTMPPPLGPGLPRPYQQKNRAPEEIAKKVRLEDFLSGEELKRFGL